MYFALNLDPRLDLGLEPRQREAWLRARNLYV